MSMRASIEDLAWTVGLPAAVLGAAYVLVGHSHVLVRPTIATQIQAHPTIIEKHAALANHLSQLAKLNRVEVLEDILAMLDEIDTVRSTASLGAEWRINRLCTCVRAALHELVNGVDVSSSEDSYAQKRVAEQDTVPAIESYLMDILQCSMLEARA